MKPRLYAFILVLICALLAGSSLRAQPTFTLSAPLIVSIENDLYLLDADLRTWRLTARPENLRQAWILGRGDVFISPNERHLLYRETPDFAANAWNNNETGNIGELPSDLVLMDLQTGETRIIASHPDNATWAAGPRYYRSGFSGRSLTWSPDGNQFVYIEFDGALYRLLLYDIPTGERRLIQASSLDTSNAEYVNDRSRFTADGIFNNRRLYSFEGDILREFAISVYSEGMIAVHDGRVLLVVDRSSNAQRILVMDVETGESFYTSGAYSFVSRANPETSLVFYDYTNDTRPAGVYTPQGELVFAATRQPPFPVDFLISPDGQQFAYTEVGENRRGGVVRDARGGELVLPGMTPVAWSPVEYVLFDPTGPVMLTPIPAAEQVTRRVDPLPCAGLPAAGLIAGGQGRVIPGGGANRLRSQPSPGAEVIGSIPEDGVFTVGDLRAVCVEDVRWVQVTYNGLDGWTAESVPGAIYVEPVE